MRWNARDLWHNTVQSIHPQTLNSAREYMNRPPISRHRSPNRLITGLTENHHEAFDDMQAHDLQSCLVYGRTDGQTDRRTHAFYTMIHLFSWYSWWLFYQMRQLRKTQGQSMATKLFMRHSRNCYSWQIRLLQLSGGCRCSSSDGI